MLPDFSNLSWGGETIENSYWKALALCLVLVFIRGWDRLIHAHLWAEDGATYLQQGLAEKWSSLFNEHAGYYQLLQRLITQIFLELPLSAFPFAVCLFCYICYAAIVAQFARSPFRVYVPSDSARILTTLVFCLIPGMVEVLGNLANLLRPAFLFAWLVLMKPPSEELKWWEIFIIAIFAASAGQIVVLFPLLAFRLYYQNKYKMPVRALFREGLTAGIILIITLFNILQPRYVPDFPIPEMNFILIALHHSIFIQLVFHPLFGPQATQLFVDATNGLILSLLGSVLLFIAMYYLLLKRGLPGKQLFLGVSLSFFIVLMTVVLRPYAAETYINGPVQLPQWFWAHRYAYQVAPFAIVLWLGVFRPKYLIKNGLLHIALVFMIGYFIHNANFFKILAYKKNANWVEDTRILESSIKSGCPSTVSVPISPEGWSFSYSSPVKIDCP